MKAAAAPGFESNSKTRDKPARRKQRSQRTNASACRVCVIGNSFLGALRRAYETLPSRDKYELSFFATPGTGFATLNINDNTIINASHHVGGSSDIRDYDCFVIYGDAPPPRRCIEFSLSISRSLFSTNVRRAALDGWMRRFNAINLIYTLRQKTDKPIFLLSRNVNRNENIGTPAENANGIAVLESIIRPCKFIAFPDSLFLATGRPNHKYYQGSLNVSGDVHKQLRHQYYHLNADGGALVLNAILTALGTI